MQAYIKIGLRWKVQIIILYLIEKLLIKAIKVYILRLAARNLLRVVAMCCLKMSIWFKITPKYLQWFDHGKLVSLSVILYLCLLSSIKREKSMDSELGELCKKKFKVSIIAGRA